MLLTSIFGFWRFQMLHIDSVQARTDPLQQENQEFSHWFIFHRLIYRVPRFEFSFILDQHKQSFKMRVLLNQVLHLHKLT